MINLLVNFNLTLLFGNEIGIAGAMKTFGSFSLFYMLTSRKHPDLLISCIE
jgi:hypothetical protein